MQDLKLKDLVDEVNRCHTNFNEAADGESITVTVYELMAAEERLNLYLKERRKSNVD